MEAGVFALVVVWMGKLLIGGGEENTSLRTLGLSLLAFLGMVLFQLVPLPPSVLRLLSPATYDLYAHSLPGWPAQIPYAALRELPAYGSWWAIPSVWRPLSIAPAQTSVDALKFCAYGGFFFLVLLYPLHSVRRPERLQPEERLLRGIIVVLLSSTVAVAGLGIFQWLTWNGKILWFFVPHDWRIDSTFTIPRASGPFVNPGHFANYLSLLLPFAIAGMISPEALRVREQRQGVRLLCGVATCVLFVGILLSLSRSAWLTTAVNLSVLLWGARTSAAETPWPKRRWLPSSFAGIVTGVGVFLLVSLFLVGSAGRQQLNARLIETVSQFMGPQNRVAVWLDTARMVSDFPLFGVGLGAWPELFPRYQRPPWHMTFYREAHNDFVEILAETGLIGTVLLGWFFWRVGGCLVRSRARAVGRARLLATAFLVSAGTMMVHAFFNFTLQVPANALLFTATLALAVRMGRDEFHSFSAPPPLTPVSRFPTFAAGVLAGILLFISLRQNAVPYPLFASHPASTAEARQMVLSYPARAAGHQVLFHFLGADAPLDRRLHELEIALGLEPLNPTLRDQYAAVLWQAGNNEAALREISRSIFFSPTPETHPYIQETQVRWLSEPEQQAIEAGFLQALRVGYENAEVGLSTFYAAVGRTADEAALYEKSAAAQSTPTLRASFLFRAATAYLRGDDCEKAEAALRQVVAITPSDLRPYRHLALQVFAPRKQFAQAKTIIEEGRRHGIDPYTLAMILAEAAQVTGERDEQQAALQQAVSLRPRSFDAHFQLGLFYVQGQKFDRAALSLRQAIEIDPQHAEAVYHLGIAEEGRYDFFAAEKTYTRAIALDPSNSEFRQRYERFRTKMTQAQETRATQ